MRKKTHTTPKWTVAKSARNYLPKEIAGESGTVAKQLNAIMKKRGIVGRVDATADQINVYTSNRRIAVYEA